MFINVFFVFFVVLDFDKVYFGKNKLNYFDIYLLKYYCVFVLKFYNEQVINFYFFFLFVLMCSYF